MTDFNSVTHVVARKQHQCCECRGIIAPLDVYERVAGSWDGSFSTFKTCQHCKKARDWLLKETDWPGDVDGEGHSYFMEQLREHLMEQAREGNRKFAFRAYRQVALMKRRRQEWAEAYNAETVRIRDRITGGAA